MIRERMILGLKWLVWVLRPLILTMLIMIRAVWNIRGINKRGRLQCITDFVAENKIDFVSLQETKKRILRRFIFEPCE